MQDPDVYCFFSWGRVVDHCSSRLGAPSCRTRFLDPKRFQGRIDPRPARRLSSGRRCHSCWGRGSSRRGCNRLVVPSFWWWWLRLRIQYSADQWLDGVKLKQRVQASCCVRHSSMGIGLYLGSISHS